MFAAFQYHFRTLHTYSTHTAIWDLLTFFAVSDDIVAVQLIQWKNTQHTKWKKNSEVCLNFKQNETTSEKQEEKRSKYKAQRLFCCVLIAVTLSSDFRRRLLHTTTFACELSKNTEQKESNEKENPNRQFEYMRRSFAHKHFSFVSLSPTLSVSMYVNCCSVCNWCVRKTKCCLMLFRWVV